MAAAAAEDDEGMCAAVARLGDVAQVNAVPPERLLRRFKELLSRVAQLRKEPPPKGDTQACLISALIHSYYGTRPLRHQAARAIHATKDGGQLTCRKMHPMRA